MRVLLLALCALLLAGFDVVVTWTDQSDNEDGFIVEHRRNGDTGPWREIGRVGIDETVYAMRTDTPRGNAMCFRVRAYNQAGKSKMSNVACKAVTQAERTKAKGVR